MYHVRWIFSFKSCEAMAYAHRKSVIHRDIKPDNIILTRRSDSGDFVKLVDFGIAKVLPSEQKQTQNLTQTGEIFGSPLYMSPEQCMGNKVDARSDIYAFGCVMYEALTGSPPFAGDNPIRTILKHINEQPKPISKLPQDYKVPADLESVIMHCLEKDPADRYQNADELLKDLEAIRDGKRICLRIPRDRKRRPEPSQPIRKWTVIMVALCIFLGLIQLALAAARLQIWLHPQPPGSQTTSATQSIRLDPTGDAQQLDNLSYRYFVSKEYEKAIPLLEFGIKVLQGEQPLLSGRQLPAHR